MAILKCIGRTDSLGTREEYGPHIGFVLQYPGGESHKIVLEEREAEHLVRSIKAAIYPDGAQK